MTGRSRRVYFEDEIETRRTRGHSRRRSRSADRVHSVYDDINIDNMQGRERVIGREAYDQLLRENQYLRIELRDLEHAQTWIAQLQQENADLQRENRELRRASDYTSDTNNINAGGSSSKTESRLHSLRKKYARLEAELADVKAKFAESKTKAADWRKLFEDLTGRYDKAERANADLARRMGILRENLCLVESAKARLEQENAALKRSLEMESLRRRHY